MLGIQLPPLYLERSLEALSRLDYFTLFFSLSPSCCDSRRFPSPVLKLGQSLLQASQSSIQSTFPSPRHVNFQRCAFQTKLEGGVSVECAASGLENAARARLSILRTIMNSD